MPRALDVSVCLIACASAVRSGQRAASDSSAAIGVLLMRVF